MIEKIYRRQTLSESIRSVPLTSWIGLGWAVFLLVVMLIATTGCTSIGLETPQNFEQKLAYAYSVDTAVLQTAATGIQQKSLTKSDGQSILKMEAGAKELLDTAKLLYQTDITTAQGKLALATTTLTEIQTYLRSKGGP